MRACLGLIVLTACGAAAPPRGPARPTTGTLTGVARDHDSGDPIEQAIIEIGARRTTSRANGEYKVADLAPGTYDLTATFAGQPLTVAHVAIHAAQNAVVDLTFTLGQPGPIREDFSVLTTIDHYTPKSLAKGRAQLEGTVNDTSTRDRIAGAVVTAVGPGVTDPPTTLQTISDESGRFKFEAVAPGVYVVSTYYSVGGRAQIEVRRSDIEAVAGQAVVIPLWIEAVR